MSVHNNIESLTTELENIKQQRIKRRAENQKIDTQWKELIAVKSDWEGLLNYLNRYKDSGSHISMVDDVNHYLTNVINYITSQTSRVRSQVNNLEKELDSYNAWVDDVSTRNINLREQLTAAKAAAKQQKQEDKANSNHGNSSSSGRHHPSSHGRNTVGIYLG
ncbi:hypothetical protein B7494_g8389 [Chlorociboria aeruginascens]|nr:hypothetical protein B7494_g8389 [Chlorociboria aeruginascens]